MNIRAYQWIVIIVMVITDHWITQWIAIIHQNSMLRTRGWRHHWKLVSSRWCPLSSPRTHFQKINLWGSHRDPSGVGLAFQGTERRRDARTAWVRAAWSFTMARCLGNPESVVAALFWLGMLLRLWVVVIFECINDNETTAVPFLTGHSMVKC